MRLQILVTSISLLAAGSGASAQSAKYFGHDVVISGQVGDDQKLTIDGKTIETSPIIAIEDVSTINGVGVLVGYLSAGGNACAETKFIVSFPKDKPYRVDGPIGDCRAVERSIRSNDILFFIKPSPSQAGSQWIWTPENGIGPEEKQPYRSIAGKSWNDLRTRQITHPAELFEFADIGAQMRDLLGNDYPEAIRIIDGTGSGAFDGDSFVGTSIVPHMGDETGALIVADIRERKVFMAWKAQNKKIVVRPDIHEWPVAAKLRLKTWAKPWYSAR
jgi:hypothetical protein